MRALLSAAPLVSMALTGTTASAASLTEGFVVVPVAGWTTVNNSTTVGSTGSFRGEPTVFPAQAGLATSYIAANNNNTAGASTISNWLISPTLTFNNGDVVSFYTRTKQNPAEFPDRLELRFSSVGGIDVGNTDTSVGTQFSSTISGPGGSTSAAIASRYFVTDGGPQGANSIYIGIDTLRITPVPEPAAYLMLALGLGVIALRRLSARAPAARAAIR